MIDAAEKGESEAREQFKAKTDGFLKLIALDKAAKTKVALEHLEQVAIGLSKRAGMFLWFDCDDPLIKIRIRLEFSSDAVREQVRQTIHSCITLIEQVRK